MGNNRGKWKRKTINLEEKLGHEDIEKIKKDAKFSTRGEVLALVGQNRKESRFMYEVYAADLYDRNEELQKAPEFENRIDLCSYLYKNHDELENRSFGYLSLALVHGEKLTKEQFDKWHNEINAANYAVKKKPLFCEEITHSYLEIPKEMREEASEKRLRKYIRERINRERFTWIENENKIISDKYMKNTLRFAMILYGNDLIENLGK